MKLLIMMLMFPLTTFAGPKLKLKRVAIIDSGFTMFLATPKTRAALCKTGHFDFTMNTPNVGYDDFGHGTYVANLIVENAERTDICLVIYKVGLTTAENTRNHIAKALVYAFNKGARVVNISLGQTDNSVIEEKVIRTVTKRGMKLFVAAGNEHKDLNVQCNIYPACARVSNDNLYVTGSKDNSDLIENYSNRGSKVQVYELGTIPGIGRGTSFAAPRALARYLRERSK